MKIEANSQCYINTELFFQEPSGIPLKLQKTTFILIQADNEVAECRIAFQVKPNWYYRIDTQALFNLKPEVRGPLIDGEFLPISDIQLEVTLQADLLPRLLAHATNAEEAAAYLLTLSQQQIKDQPSISQPEPAETQPAPEPEVAASQSQTFSVETHTEVPNQSESSQPNTTKTTIDPLLYTESWLCLSVKQQQGDTETGFSTFWSYVNPTVLQQAATSGEQISEGIADFFKEWVAANLTEAVQEVTDEFLEEITSVFEGLTDDLSALDGDTVDGELFETVVSFFEANDWPTAQVESNTALQLAFQGENGQWACYAATNEESQEFVFYSLCPVNVPENQRLAMAEFLTRANYGITIGNFEMNFDSGEINYKTSINVEGDQISISLVRQLVYTNVMVMDRYLPGIMAVIYGNVSPIDAIVQIED